MDESQAQVRYLYSGKESLERRSQCQASESRGVRPASGCGGTVDARRLKRGRPTDGWVRLPPPLPRQFLSARDLFSRGSSPRGATLWRGIRENNHLAIPAYNGVQQGFDGTESRTRSGPGAGFDSPVLHLLFPVYRSVRRRVKERHPIPDQTRRTPTDSLPVGVSLFPW